MQFFGGPPYSKRPVADVKEGVSGLVRWLGLELASVQRGTARASSRTVTDDFTVLISDGLLLVDASGGAVSATLPAANLVPDLTVIVKKIDSSGHAVTLVGTVDGVVNPTLATQWKAKMIWAAGGAWHTVSAV